MQADECHLLTSHHQPSAMPNRRHLFQVQQEAVVHRHKSESVQQVSRVSRRPSNYVSAPRHAMSHWTTSQMSSHPLQAVRDRAPSDKGCPSPRRTASQASNRPNHRSIHIQSTCNSFLFLNLNYYCSFLFHEVFSNDTFFCAKRHSNRRAAKNCHVGSAYGLWLMANGFQASA